MADLRASVVSTQYYGRDVVRLDRFRAVVAFLPEVIVDGDFDWFGRYEFVIFFHPDLSAVFGALPLYRPVGFSSYAGLRGSETAAVLMTSPQTLHVPAAFEAGLQVRSSVDRSRAFRAFRRIRVDLPWAGVLVYVAGS